MNRTAYELLGRDSVSAAVRVFEWNAELYPGSANVYDSLGDACAAACRLEDARASYERAIARATETSDPVLPTSAENLRRITAQLAKGGECPAGG